MDLTRQKQSHRLTLKSRILEPSALKCFIFGKHDKYTHEELFCKIFVYEVLDMVSIKKVKKEKI